MEEVFGFQRSTVQRHAKEQQKTSGSNSIKTRGRMKVVRTNNIDQGVGVSLRRDRYTKWYPGRNVVCIESYGSFKRKAV